MKSSSISFLGMSPFHGNSMKGILEVLESLFKTRLDERGRIYIPKSIREKLSMKEDDRVYLKIEGDRLVLHTTRSIKRQLTESSFIVE